MPPCLNPSILLNSRICCHEPTQKRIASKLLTPVTGKPPTASPSVPSGYPPGGAAAAAATAALMDPATSAYYAALYSQQMYGAAGLSPYAAADATFFLSPLPHIGIWKRRREGGGREGSARCQTARTAH